MPDSDPFAALGDEPAADTREMHAAIDAFAATMPPATPESVAQLRAAAAQQAQPKLPQAAELIAPSRHGGVPLRVFRPEDARGVYLQMHGGGWTGGSNDSQDGELQELADATGLVVLSVNYRLAPENPFPAPQDDCEIAARWVLDHARSEFGADLRVLGGFSAGAHLALVTALRLRDRHGYSDLAALDLRSGCYDLRLTPSARLHPGNLLNGEQLRRIVAMAAGSASLDDPDVSPLLADLHGLPPAVMVVGGGESLLDDTLFLYSRWRALGIDAELIAAPGAWHLFDKMHPRLGPEVRSRVFAFLNAHLHAFAELEATASASAVT